MKPREINSLFKNLSKIIKNPKTDLTYKNLTENEITALENQIPIGRLAEPSDISKTSIYLISNLNKYITGQNIIVDGGYTNI